MSVSYRKPRIKNAVFHRFLVLIALVGVNLLIMLLLRTNTTVVVITRYSTDDECFGNICNTYSLAIKKNLNLPIQNLLSLSLEKLNQMPPRNMDLYPNLAKNHIVIVLYVHNRPQYLRLVVNSLSRVAGINETLLIVSHDGYFEEMNKIIDSIKFCQVKQIFAIYSPHVFQYGFPGASSHEGTPDQYGNHRLPKIVSLKHHWWWMMNTVWDGLNEIKGHFCHILFIEEDHFIYPNAYRNLQLLTDLKPKKCPHCYAVNLAPFDVKSKGERFDSLVAEKMGNVGYSFNPTVWRMIHKKAREFCLFDDYNWDIKMWAAVYPSFEGPVYSLRASRTSAVHFGTCGLHQGQGEKEACFDYRRVNFKVEDIDDVLNVRSDWGVHVYKHQQGYQAGFKGWGGWGDIRDHQLCMDFSEMYGPLEDGEV